MAGAGAPCVTSFKTASEPLLRMADTSDALSLLFGCHAVEETPHTAQKTEGTATQPERDGAGPPDEDPVLRQADNDEDDEEDVNDTCGFCQFMRGGGCRRAFNVS